jgi:aminoglycoside phosphotransferase (APT) family kinase protein
MSTRWPFLTVTTIPAGDVVEAVASSELQERWIRPDVGDLVMIEPAGPLPLVTFSWWRATVIEVRRRRAVIDPPPSGAQRNPTVRLPEDGQPAINAADVVYCSRTAIGDIEIDGEPARPERLTATYLRERPAGLTQDGMSFAAVEVPIEEPLVRGLVDEQFPHWADLPLRKIYSWENAMFRLGDELVVRLTKGRWAMGQLEKEHRWLPRFSPHLPLPIPVPLAMGRPGFGYPWRWSVCTWVEGEDATPERITDHEQAGIDLAEFLTALQSLDATGGPVVGQPPHIFGWTPLAEVDRSMRQRFLAAAPSPEQTILEKAWNDGLNAAPWDGPPVFLHGDLAPDNVLARDGRLCGVIDFGVLSIGDPAYDYAGAWRLLSTQGRRAFREALNLDDDTWKRARAWAVRSAREAVIADEHYRLG